MSKDNKEKETYTYNKNDVLFPLIFGIAAVIIMAIVSHFMGK